MSRRGTHAKKKKKGPMRLILLILSLGAIIACAIYMITWSKANSENQAVLESIKQETIQTNQETGEAVIDFEKLFEKNKDTIGWLTVNNTSIDYPVVKGNDNDFYLTHNFNKESNLGGWLFADYRMKADGTDKNLVIHGHNMKNGSMFGTLKKVLNKDWYENSENLEIIYETKDKEYKYKVFSIYQIEVESYYTKRNFASNQEYQEFLNKIKGRSKKDFGINLSVSDKIMTLSTCASNDNYRVVLHAVLSND